MPYQEKIQSETLFFFFFPYLCVFGIEEFRWYLVEIFIYWFWCWPVNRRGTRRFLCIIGDPITLVFSFFDMRITYFRLQSSPTQFGHILILIPLLWHSLSRDMWWVESNYSSLKSSTINIGDFFFILFFFFFMCAFYTVDC